MFGTKAQSLMIYLPLVFCCLCSISIAEATLTSGEIAALEQIYSNFPSLAVAHSQIAELYTHPLGKAWSTNFTSFCDHGEGYEFHGIYCHDGHVSGINITRQWDKPISTNFSLISGLQYVKNVTNIFQSFNAALIALVQDVAVECIDGSSQELTDTAFAFPESLLRLYGDVSSTFNISAFSNLRELRLKDYPEASIINTWIWPYDTLEVLELQYPHLGTKNPPVDWWLNHYQLFPALRVLKGVWYAGTNGTLIQAVVESQTLQYLGIHLRGSVTPVNLTINCSTCLEVQLSWEAATVYLTAPSVQKLNLNTDLSWPQLSTPLPDLTELIVLFVGRNHPPEAFPNLDFAPSLTHFKWVKGKTDHANWVRVLCSLPSTIRSLSLLQVEVDQTMQFPSCLNSLTSIDLLGPTLRYDPTTLLLNLPTSLTSLSMRSLFAAPVSMDKFKKFTQLRSLGVEDSYLVGDIPADFLRSFPQLSNFFCTASVTGTIPSVGWNSVERFMLSAPVTSWEGIDTAPNLWYLSVASQTIKRLPSDEQFLAAKLHSLLFFRIGYWLPGPVPTFWNSLPNIEEIHLSSNRFSGPFTTPLSSPKLLRVDLSRNHICGSLPEVSAPIKLVSLILHENQFSGSIPDSWSANISHVSRLTFYSNPINGTLPDGLIEKNLLANLANTNLVGPLWKMSHYTPRQITIINSGVDICAIDPEIPLGIHPICQFNNITSCPEDCPSYWPCAPSSLPCNRLTRFVPRNVGECIAPPVPSSSLHCPPPAPPGFVCVNGQYISQGSVTLERVTLPPEAGVILVKGNISINGTLTYSGLGSTIEIEGCLDLAPSQIQIVETSSDAVPPKTLIHQKGSDCAIDLSKIPVVLDERKDGCKRSKLSTSESTRSSLVVAFTIDSSRCNIKWIILGSVLGGVVVLSAVAVLLVFSPTFRAFMKTRCKK